MGDRLFILLQYLLPHHFLSRIVHALTRSRSRWLKDALIGAFVRHFRPEMRDALQPDPHRYASFNEFFTRALAPDARPLDTDPDIVVSPVDGSVSQIGYLDGTTLVQAKGSTYGLDALLAGGRWVRRFEGGAFATLYLAPYNYHRIHMPCRGALTTARYVPGRLFSVNALTANAVPGLFARNERVICGFAAHAAAVGAIAAAPDFALILVGALFVGSMTTLWHGDITPTRSRTARDLSAPLARASQGTGAAELSKGEEMGRFNMGSTVILLYPRDVLAWLPALGPGARIRMGQALGRLWGPW